MSHRVLVEREQGIKDWNHTLVLVMSVVSCKLLTVPEPLFAYL